MSFLWTVVFHLWNCEGVAVYTSNYPKGIHRVEFSSYGVIGWCRDE